MKLLLITVSSPEIKQIRLARYIKFQQCTMPYLSSLFPKSWDIRHIDEECENIEFTEHFDIVGLTFHTPCCYHAYEIAKKFKAKGSYIIMGGPHVTLVPDEAQNHADSIFVGESELTLPHFIKDFENSTPKKRYTCDEIPDLENLPMMDKSLFHRKDYASGTMFATRGCPNSCEFCAIRCIYAQSFRKRPVKEAALEFGSFKGKVIVFWDDNISADLEYSKELFRAITPYKKWWTCQASITCGEDDEFLELAHKSGCKHLFIGFESITQMSLDNSNKAFNKVDQYKQIIKRIHSHGISIQAGIVFGFDCDHKDVFQKTLDFLIENGIQNATFNMLTPYPNTPLFHRLKAQGRILTEDWSKYNSRTNVVFQPKYMTPQELQDGFNWINKEFYKPINILKRFKNAGCQRWWQFPLNLTYSYLLAKKLKQEKPV